MPKKIVLFSAIFSSGLFVLFFSQHILNERSRSNEKARQAGLEVFLSHDCTDCHRSENLTPTRPSDFGLKSQSNIGIKTEFRTTRGDHSSIHQMQEADRNHLIRWLAD